MINYKFEAYSIAGITILIAGLLRLYIYYKGFNISILPFLEPGEIGTIFFDNLLYFIGFTILNVVVISIFYKGCFDLIAKFKDFGFLKRLKAYGLLKFNKLTLFLLLSAIMYWIKIESRNIYLYEYFLWILLLLISIYINPIIIFESKRILIRNSININHLSIVFLAASLNLFLFAGFSGANEAYKVKKLNYYKGTEFDIDDLGKIISNDTKYYIGKTRQFVFFYDSNNEKTEVIPISKVKSMKY